MRGNPPPSYQAFITQQAGSSLKDYYQQNPFNSYQNAAQPQQYQNVNQPHYAAAIMTRGTLATGESRQPASNLVIRKSSGVSATPAQRDFVQENKRVYAQLANPEK